MSRPMISIPSIYRRIAVTILILGLSVSAAAQDDAPIQITVPVSLQDMHPDVASVMVFCYLFDADGSYLSESARSEPQSLEDGSFSGDIVAVANGDPSIAELAHSYLCWMHFGISGAMGTHQPGPLPTTRFEPTPYVADRLKVAEGTRFVYYAEGTFP